MAKSCTQTPQIRTPARRSFNFADRYAADAIEFELVDPASLTPVGVGVFFTISSVYSDEAKEAALAERATHVKEDATVDVDAVNASWDKNLFEQTVAVLKTWRSEPDDGHPGTVRIDDEYLPCTPVNVRRLFTDSKTVWAQKQTQGKYLAVADFFGKPKRG